MVLRRFLILVAIGSFFLNVYPQEKIISYYLGKAKEKEVLTAQIELPKKVSSFFAECECLKVDLEEKLLKVSLDTTGYKGKNELSLYLIFEDSSVLKIVFSFEVE